MEPTHIREPKQKRSMEKKNRIIEAGFVLFTEKGYHNTNTAEIASHAGVSTGTVYSYFRDKKAVFMAVLDGYAEGIMGAVYKLIKELRPPYRFEEILEKIMDMTLETHTYSKATHDEMMAMAFLDEDVQQYMTEFEVRTVRTLAELLRKLGIQTENDHEKVHIAFNMIESYCHEMVYHRHDFIDYGVMKRQIIDMITRLFFEKERGDD